MSRIVALPTRARRRSHPGFISDCCPEGVPAPDLEPTAANERLTATTATVLLALLAVEGLTILSIRQLLSLHIIIGLALIPPVALKLASTGYRFFRYYTGDAAYVERGPPHLAMRLLAPLLVVSTLTVLGSGVALLALGPERHRDLILGLHKASFVVWFVVTGIHVLVYLPRLPRALASRRAGARIGLVAASVAAGGVLPAGAYSLADPWLHRAHEHEREGSASLVVKCTPARAPSENPSAGLSATSSSSLGRPQRSYCSRSM
jgi:hypothetical protein